MALFVSELLWNTWGWKIVTHLRNATGVSQGWEMSYARK
uniref:Uncharacterized protein n=1 Tax=Anguilla anguilla TaxID=7936 RepID=A0A0E9QBJ1_ANGAN